MPQSKSPGVGELLLISDPVTVMSKELAGKSNSHKEQYILAVFGARHISKTHESLGFWIVSIGDNTGIFSLKDNTFLKIPQFNNGSEYFGKITTAGPVALEDGSTILTITFGGLQTTSDDWSNIEHFCYIENGRIEIYRDLPTGTSLKVAINMFRVWKNRIIIQELQDQESHAKMFTGISSGDKPTLQ